MGFDILFNFLDKKIIFDNEKSSIKKIIIQGFDSEKRTKIIERLKEELDKIAKENYNGNHCYLFDMDYGDSNLGIDNKFDVCSFTCTDERLSEYMDSYKLQLLSKSISSSLYSEKGPVKIKFYLGVC
jgi:uncharacterized protein (DUF2344 family)